MTNYYKIQSHFYDSTRWAFLYGRKRLIEELDIRRGECVVEIGCGTGANFRTIQNRLQNTGELIGIDCSAPMLRKAEQRALQNGWTNIHLRDLEYGMEPVTDGRADVVLFSYSLSMIEDWRSALHCAQSELRPGGRAGVLDFCRTENSSAWFAKWLDVNHVAADRPCPEELHALFDKNTYLRYDAWAGLWSFYLFVGLRRRA
jgi:S-adenosylmethionine-diacylgycerolhomoserine-N-methlytransferase